MRARWIGWTLAIIMPSLLAEETPKPVTALPSANVAAEPDPVLIAKVDALVPKLNDPSFVERESATKDLRALDASILPLLKARRAATTDSEAQLRLDGLIAWHTPLKAVVKDTVVKVTAFKQNAMRADGTVASFDARPSIAANFNAKLKYQWKQIEGETVNIPVQQMDRPTIHFRTEKPGKSKFELVVSDDRRKSEPIVIELIAEAPPADENEANAAAAPNAVNVQRIVVKPALKVEVRKEAKADEKAEVKAEVKAETKSEVKAETKAEAKTEIIIQGK